MSLFWVGDSAFILKMGGCLKGGRIEHKKANPTYKMCFLTRYDMFKYSR